MKENFGYMNDRPKLISKSMKLDNRNPFSEETNLREENL